MSGSAPGRVSQGEDGGARQKQTFQELVDGLGKNLVQILQVTEEANAVSRRAVERIQKMDSASTKICAASRAASSAIRRKSGAMVRAD